MFERKINLLGKSSSSATKKILRRFRGVRQMSQAQYENARLDYNREVQRRKNAIKQIQTTLDNNLRNIGDGFTFDLTEVHNSYGIESFLKYLIERIDAINPEGKYVLTMGDHSYTMSSQNRRRLLDRLINQIVVEERLVGSDSELIQNIRVYNSFRLEPLTFTNQRNRNGGEFFPYHNKTKFDFSKYGVFKEDDKGKGVVCFVQALTEGGLSNEKYEALISMIEHSKIPKSQIKDICQKLQIKIILREDGQKNIYTYGKEFEETYEIGLIDNHYFIFEKANITRYALEHYDEVKDHPRANEIFAKEGSKYKYKTDRCINSMDLFRILLEHKGTLIEKYSFDELTATPYYKSFNNEITTLEYDETGIIEIENNIKEEIEKNKDNSVNIFADFETLVYEECHEPYLCCYSNEGKTYSFIGENCGADMLWNLSKHFKSVRLIFHNATYDYQFLVKHLYQFSQICRGTHLLTAKGMFDKMKVEIKCSYNMISTSLSKFGKMFNLPQEKEVMPYSIYTKENINKQYLSVYEVSQTFKNIKDRLRFVNNIDKWQLRRHDGTFDIIEYSRLYCVMDCIVLENGYNVFRNWIMNMEYIIDETGKTEKCGLDINHIITSASLAHKYMILSGCYDSVYELNGVPQRFIQKSVVGGRTMMANNKKQYINQDYCKTKEYRKISDFDGVSLYPSAMRRMYGFLKGKPKVLQTTDYNIIKNYDGYFVEIKVHNIPIKRAFPLMSEKNDDGIRVFTNELKSNIIVDKIQLEDLIQFHGLSTNDFTIIRGYYFNDGFNNRINTAINYLFETRKKMKKEKNPSQEIYKLIMNSAYGKSIMKEITTETRFFDNYTETDKEKYKAFVSRNYEWIDHITHVYGCDKKIVHLIKPICDHFNIAQVGSSVLSWSKRIMNEVMCLAEDNGIEIFYQDTDSMHMYEDTIEKLSNAFKLKYNRDLIGEELGQFHTDFDIVYEDENGIDRKCKEVHSRQLITLGKKCYIDELVGIDHEGKERVSYHMRMKGVSNKAIEYAIEEHEYESVINLYDDLFKGEAIEFDLCCGGSKAVFKYSGALSVKTVAKFSRLIQF